MNGPQCPEAGIVVDRIRDFPCTVVGPDGPVPVEYPAGVARNSKDASLILYSPRNRRYIACHSLKPAIGCLIGLRGC